MTKPSSTPSLRLLLASGVGLGLLAVALPAAAGGFYIQEQSVKGLGRAYSGEASDTGADSLWWNPAAIAGVNGIEVEGGTHAILSDSKVKDQGSTIQRPGQARAPVGGEPRAYNPLEPGIVPNGAVAWRVNEHVSLGLSIAAPFDFSTKYETNAFTRYDALTSKLLDIDVQPTLAVRVNRYLDLGVGFDVQYTKATLSSALPNLSPLLPDGNNRLEGDGFDFGYVVGAQLHPTDRLTVGGSYRSKVDHELDGVVAVTGLLGPLAASNATLAGKASFTTPWIATLGLRYILNDHWAFNVQSQRIGWSEFSAIDVATAAGTTVIPQNYHDTSSGAVGVDYTVNPMWTMRAGVAYDPTPTPDASRTARVPDGDRYLYTVGATIRPSPRMELNAAIGYIDLQHSRITDQPTDYAGTPVAAAIGYNGEATGSAFILSTGVKFHF